MFDLNNVVQGSAANLKAPIICIHGKAGVGKTTFGAGAPDNLFIPVEDGMGILAAQPNLTMTPIPETFANVESIIDALIHQEHNYKWVTIDSLTSLEKKLWHDLCKQHSQDSIESFGYGKGFTLALETFSKLILKLRQLRDLRGVGVILVAHSQPVTMSPPDKEPFDYYGIQVHKKLADFIHSQCDLVGFCEKELIVKSQEQGFATKGKAVETGQRLLHCYSTEQFSSKNRYGMEDMRPISLSFDALMQTIGSKIPQQLQTEVSE